MSGTPPRVTAGSRVDAAVAAGAARRSLASITPPGGPAVVRRTRQPPAGPRPILAQAATRPRQLPARCRYSCTVPSPIEQLRAICRSPRPTENLKRRTSLIFRMDYVPGNIIHVMCPPPLCGRLAGMRLIQGERAFFGHITLQRLEPIQQGGIGLPSGFRGILSSAAPGTVHFSKAACLVRRVISA